MTDTPMEATPDSPIEPAGNDGSSESVASTLAAPSDSPTAGDHGDAPASDAVTGNAVTGAAEPIVASPVVGPSGATSSADAAPADPSPDEGRPGAPVPAAATTPAAASESPAVEMTAAPPRSAADAYVFSAVLCAVVGLVVPVIPAAAALMLVRATDDDLTHEPLRPGLSQIATFARGLAWFDLAWMTLATIAFLLGTLGRVIS